MTADQGQQQPQQRRDWAKAARVLHQYVAASNQALGAGAIGGHSELVHAAQAGAEACEQVAWLTAEVAKRNDDVDGLYDDLYLAWGGGGGLQELLGLAQAQRLGEERRSREQAEAKLADLALFAADLLDLLAEAASHVKASGSGDDSGDDSDHDTRNLAWRIEQALAADADPLAAGRRLREELEYVTQQQARRIRELEAWELTARRVIDVARRGRLTGPDELWLREALAAHDQATQPPQDVQPPAATRPASPALPPPSGGAAGPPPSEAAP